jgi:Zn-dependent protease
VFSLSEPTPTRFDVRFSLFGVPVRITPFFWVAAFLLGMGLTGNDPALILMWIVAVFLSILIHELGHVAAYHFYGMRGYVVLYHFGGLAVRSDGSSYFSSFDSFRYSRGVMRPQQQLVISAAGPAAQLLLAILIFLAVRLSGHHLTWPGTPFPYHLPFLPSWISVGEESAPFANDALNNMTLFVIIPSVMWALLNLLPIFPLDGGQIARSLFIMFGGPNGIRNSLILSIMAGIGVAVYGMSNRDLFMTLMFGSLAFSSYQLLTTTYGGGYGGRW